METTRPSRIRDASIGYRFSLRNTMQPKGWAIAFASDLYGKSINRFVRRILARTKAGRIILDGFKGKH